MLTRAAGPSKGTALAELCALAGCTLADAVAVGDWFNDVPMFEVAGRSFVMGHAPEAVRAKASDGLERVAGSRRRHRRGRAPGLGLMAMARRTRRPAREVFPFARQFTATPIIDVPLVAATI